MEVSHTPDALPLHQPTTSNHGMELSAVSPMRKKIIHWISALLDAHPTDSRDAVLFTMAPRCQHWQSRSGSVKECQNTRWKNTQWRQYRDGFLCLDVRRRLRHNVQQWDETWQNTAVLIVTLEPDNQQHNHPPWKICDIDDLQKCLMQTWFDFEQNVIDAAIIKWHDRLRSCVRAGGRHSELMLWNYCSFVLHGLSEHFMKLSM